MGWKLKVLEEENKEPKYKIWSTISDSFLFEEWMTKGDILKYLFWLKFEDFVTSFLDSAVTFPEGYRNIDTNSRIPIGDKTKEFGKLREKSLHDSEVLYTKFLEILIEHGIDFGVDDGKYNMNTKELE